jgi:hypothetical protein
MRVAAAGQSVDFTADITGMWAWDPGWNPHVWSFKASSLSTTIEFYSLMSGDTGPALDSVTVELTSLVGVETQGAPAFSLSPSVPNPTGNASRMEYTVPRSMAVRLSILDLAGRSVAVLADGVVAAGRHAATWDGRTATGRAPSGLYLVELRAPGRQVVRRLTLLR